MKRTLWIVCFFVAGLLGTYAQDIPEGQQTGQTGNENTPVTQQGGGQATPSDPAQVGNDDAGNANQGGEGVEAEGEQRADSVRATGPRVRRIYERDDSRRVVLRRRTRSGGTAAHGNLVQREGYRIQIFTGGNRRQDHQRAVALGEFVKQHFPELSAYSQFVCPRWTCRVGDFEKPEQANRYVTMLLRSSKDIVEARVVKCMVWLPK